MQEGWHGGARFNRHILCRSRQLCADINVSYVVYIYISWKVKFIDIVIKLN